MANTIDAGVAASRTTMLRGYVMPETLEFIKQSAEKSGRTRGQVIDELVRASTNVDMVWLSHHAAYQAFVGQTLAMELLQRQAPSTSDKRSAGDILAEIEAAAEQQYGALVFRSSDEG